MWSHQGIWFSFWRLVCLKCLTESYLRFWIYHKDDVNLTIAMACDCHFSGRVTNICIHVILYRSNQTLMCHISVKSFFIYHLGSTDSSCYQVCPLLMFQGTCPFPAYTSLSALKSAWKQAFLNACLVLSKMLQSGVEWLCDDVESTMAVVFAKSWKPVQKSSHISRCTFRCFWDWSPYHVCCWSKANLESSRDSWSSLQIRFSSLVTF